MKTILFLISFILTGCVVSQPNVQENEGTISGTNLTTTATAMVNAISVTLLPSATPQTLMPTGTPLPTATATPSVILTTTPTTMPTLTPLPTVAPQQRRQIYADLMSSNGGCTLPCWWGFELGVASLDEVRQFYMAFDTHITERVENNGISELTVKFVDPQIENGIQIRHIFIAQNDIIVEAEIEAEIEAEYDPNYRIESLLKRLGQPSDVWIWTIPEPSEDVLPMTFRVFFPEIGVMIGYAVFAERVGNTVQACFDTQGGTRLLLWNPLLWDPSSDKGIVERVSESSTFTLENFSPIEEVSNWDVEQFYTVLTNPTHTECLETPSSLWPSPA